MAKAPGQDTPGPVSLEIGTRVCDYIIGPKIGQGAFGEIYCAIDQNTGILWALKTESSLVNKKVLPYEYQVLDKIQESPHFPRVGMMGTGPEYSFFSMELLGPSISHILKSIPGNKFTFSTAIRASYHMLKCIEALHIYGYVHRDIKPGNILTREGTEHPLCLIDFGLARCFVNPETGMHLLQRPPSGFRGTRAYASLHAHYGEDLARRDDVISWFYSAYEFITGTLPWKKSSDSSETQQMKEHFDPSEALSTIAPEMIKVWKHILTLEFMDMPNYGLCYRAMAAICKRCNIKLNDPFDWGAYLHSHRQKVAQSLKSFGDKLNGPVHGYIVRTQPGQSNAKGLDELEGDEDQCYIA
ncbi:CK1 family protein kinase [Trichomonas vaginalis G3]|uniref:non-specific serine/threonine protein kinase n=1 Tax=Trichomonas vaginalis (strain ATCC PRA-98 / G3) TaxID=412133 RepID=A2F5P7_TRIV3|nr:protein kinase protein [Trichomonas vaginalis G3]EAX99747.1 CK1 family protein kinase [Trichomonas vaginalis G3]KAI5489031.1 protein kinase protein [Trichomonas vaginalis G3]|eukprot:XP_001312677.1 CK1 family protein kinase [Trichomonas vaginalis G3]